MDTKNESMEIIKKSWQELREKLCSGHVKYNDIEELKKINFFAKFNDMFQKSGEFATVKLSEIDLLLRSCSGKGHDRERFMALKKGDKNWEEKKDLLGVNRYNEPERGFMYFGIRLRNYPKSRKYVKETCAKEIRAFNNDRIEFISTLEFKVINEFKEKKVLDFSKISGYNSCDDIEKEMNKFLCELSKMYKKVIEDKYEKLPVNVYSCQRVLNVKKTLENSKSKTLNEIIAEIYLVKFYLKLINDSTFKYIDEKLSPDEKKYEYVPFHAFANYIEYMGYSGIIYNSTVHKGGLNLVLFNRDEVECFGEIEVEKSACFKNK